MDEALEGGISDPRNASVFKMFVLVNVGNVLAVVCRTCVMSESKWD